MEEKTIDLKKRLAKLEEASSQLMNMYHQVVGQVALLKDLIKEAETPIAEEKK